MKGRIALYAATLLLAACGGSSDDGPTIEGEWKGTYAVPEPDSTTTLFSVAKAGGPAFFFDKLGFIYIMPSVQSGDKIAESGYVYPPYGFIFVGGKSRLAVGIKGTLADSALTGSFTLGTYVAPYDLQTFQPMSGTPSVVGGNWTGTYVQSGRAFSFAVSQSGHMHGTDWYGCTYDGTITQVAGGENLFDVDLQNHGNGPICAHHFIGLAYEADSDELDLYGDRSGTYYYVVAYDSAEALVAAFRVND